MKNMDKQKKKIAKVREWKQEGNDMKVIKEENEKWKKKNIKDKNKNWE